MNAILIPLFFLSVLPNEIKLSEQNKIKGHIITPGHVVKRGALCLFKTDWIILKSIVENTNTNCKNIVLETANTCKKEIKRCRDDFQNLPHDQELLIKSLKVDISEKDLIISKNKKTIEVLKYIAIGAGAVALSSGAYIIFK
tara:strand:+ start:72 stop:497 length:426 start_codon:yes stop_codon:yes gene_type:complete